MKHLHVNKLQLYVKGSVQSLLDFGKCDLMFMIEIETSLRGMAYLFSMTTLLFYPFFFNEIVTFHVSI